MEDEILKISLPENVLQPLFSVSSSSNLNETLEFLIEASRTPSGRLDLGSKNILSVVLQLCQSLSYPLGREILLLSLKLLRNLCAGEMANQNSFIEQNGVEVVSTIFSSVVLDPDSDSDYGVIRMGNVYWELFHWLEKHINVLFGISFFQPGFLRLQESGNGKLVIHCVWLYILVLAEIVRTASTVGFGEDWLKLLLSRICFDESHFPLLFSKSCPDGTSGSYENAEFRDDLFASEQAFLMDILSEILNEQINEITVSSDVASCVLGILHKSTGVIDSVSGCKSGFSSRSNTINVLKYSLTILRDICAQTGQRSSHQHGSEDAFDLFVSSGLLELLLRLLRDLEPPVIIRKVIKQEGSGGMLLLSLATVHTEGSMYKMKSERGMGYFYYCNNV